MNQLKMVGIAAVLAIVTATPADATDARLRADLYPAGDFVKSALAKAHCAVAPAPTRGVVSDVLVGLVGKATGALLDGIAAKLRADAQTLEARSSIDAFYEGKRPTLAGACLVIHNGKHPDGDNATLAGVFQIEFSKDLTAWRLENKFWKFDRFLIATTRWGQLETERDFALTVRLSKPGQDGGEKASVLETILSSASLSAIQKAFQPGEKLPWMPVLVAPSSEQDKVFTQPMNLRVTVVETTKANQLATWLREAAAEKKDEVVSLAKDLARRALDSGYAASEDAKAAVTAAGAYNDYKSAWDAWAQLLANKPADPGAAAQTDNTVRLRYEADLNSWIARVQAAKALVKAKGIAAAGSFNAADLGWPGELPDLPEAKR